MCIGVGWSAGHRELGAAEADEEGGAEANDKKGNVLGDSVSFGLSALGTWNWAPQKWTREVVPRPASSPSRTPRSCSCPSRHTFTITCARNGN